YSQQVQIQWGEQVVLVINNHFEAYDQADRVQQANALAKMLPRVTNVTGVVIAGGDMNTTPPEATMQYGYPDRPNADHRGDTTMNALRNIAGFEEAVKVEDYLKNGSDFFTATAHAPNRRLDYLFVPERTCGKSTKTHTTEFYEVLDTRFEVADLNQALPEWERVYNTVQPHQPPEYLTPKKFLKLHQQNKRKEEVSLII
ncbi:MAG: hypothetical protein JW732_03560, partial [Dehalococcoidia bacterium]|nr:hypothetical protein [Dehalococcoidia bacterium]